MLRSVVARRGDTARRSSTCALLTQLRNLNCAVTFHPYLTHATPLRVNYRLYVTIRYVPWRRGYCVPFAFRSTGLTVAGGWVWNATPTLRGV